MSFPFPFICPTASSNVVYVGESEDTTNASAYTFTSEGIGNAASDRIVHIGIIGNVTSGSPTILSVTIGGNDAEINCQNTESATGCVGIASLAVASGTTANIVVTFSASILHAWVCVWASYGAASHVAYHTDTDISADPGTVSINVPASGFSVGARLGIKSGGYVGTTWGGLTESCDVQSADNANRGMSGAAKEFSSAQTGLSVTADTDSTSSAFGVLAVASFGPIGAPRIWTSGGALATARMGLAGCGSHSAGLAFGGYDAAYKTTTEEYGGNSWSSGGALSTARRGLGGCGTQTAGLSFGGADPAYKTTTEEYNGSSWSSGGAYVIDAEWTAGAGTQSAGLGFGGERDPGGGPVFIDSCGEYDGATWSSGGALFLGKSKIAGCGTQTAGLSFGGADPAYKTTTEEYNGASWSSGGSLSTARGQLAGCGTQTSGVSFGGYDGSNKSTTEEYNGASWSSGGSLSTSRYALSGCGLQSLGLSFGGYDGAYKSTTEEYH